MVVRQGRHDVGSGATYLNTMEYKVIPFGKNRVRMRFMRKPPLVYIGIRLGDLAGGHGACGVGDGGGKEANTRSLRARIKSHKPCLCYLSRGHASSAEDSRRPANVTLLWTSAHPGNRAIQHFSFLTRVSQGASADDALSLDVETSLNNTKPIPKRIPPKVRRAACGARPA